MDQEKDTAPLLEARIWDTERRIGGPTSYFLIILDGTEEIAVELKYDPKQKQISADVYTPADYNYTIHDFCDHENDDCIVDSEEFQEAEARDNGLRFALAQLRQAAEQQRVSVIVQRLAGK